jgi:hypothetical protein
MLAVFTESMKTLVQSFPTHGTLKTALKLSRHTINFLRDFIIKITSKKIVFKNVNN